MLYENLVIQYFWGEFVIILIHSDLLIYFIGVIFTYITAPSIACAEQKPSIWSHGEKPLTTIRGPLADLSTYILG